MRYIEQIKELSKNLPNNEESKEGLEHREGYLLSFVLSFLLFLSFFFPLLSLFLLIYLHKRFGLAYDCHPFPMMYDYVAMVAGASLVATRLLCEKECKVAINTEGGRHRMFFPLLLSSFSLLFPLFVLLSSSLIPPSYL